jgi:hypothetical protein
MLLCLTEDELLSELGITQKLHRRRIFQGIQKLKEMAGNTANVLSPGTTTTAITTGAAAFCCLL